MTDSPDSLELVQLGQAAARVGRGTEAKKYLRQAVELNPDSVDAWLALGGVEDDPVEKIACFERALSLEPDNTEARLALQLLTQDAETDVSDEPVAEGELEAVIAEASRRLDEAVGAPTPDDVPPDDEVLYCANHPSVETVLRCNRCGKPICTRCAVRTPVGYRCRECVGQQQSAFYTGGALDYVIGGGIALVLGGLAAYLMTLIGGWFFAIILGPTVGVGIAEAVRFGVRRRKSRYLWLVVGGAIVLGSFPAFVLGLFSLWGLLSLGLFLVLSVGAATARLR